jgi:hypothetical protein
MRSIVFDAGPVISLTTNNLLWLLDRMKREFDGDFYIPPAVKYELVDKPLASRKFKFEALQVLSNVKKGVFRMVDTPQIKVLAEELLSLANHTFKIKGNWLTIVHYAEMEALATAIIMNSSAVVIDERTTKLLIEEPKELVNVFEGMFHSRIYIDQKNFDKVKNWTKNIRVIRSVELVIVAFEKGMLDEYAIDGADSRRVLVESLLWGVKLHGCAISRREIEEILKLESS